MNNSTQPHYISPEEKAVCVIKDAEARKARILPKTGKQSTAVIDEGYVVVASHMDENTVLKVQRGEYIDFGKLILKDRILVEEDQQLEMIIKGGKAFYILVSETTTISSFSRWEQAFRVYSNIYSKAQPHRSSELIEYNHIIHMISLTYIWDNVYLYDKDFRIHMSKNPTRSWGIILQ